MKFGDTTEKIVEIRLPQQYRDLVAEGDEVYGVITKTNTDFSATIKQIAPSADDMTKTVLVKLSLKDDLPLGSIVKVYFNLEKNKEENHSPRNIIIPLSFIRYEYGQAYVWVWNTGIGKTEKRNIELGECGERSCEVEEGLQSGEVVVRL